MQGDVAEVSGMKLSKALQVREVEQLRQSGSFRVLKAGLEEQLHATLRANSWLALFERLSCLRERGHHVSEQASSAPAATLYALCFYVRNIGLNRRCNATHPFIDFGQAFLSCFDWQVGQVNIDRQPRQIPVKKINGCATLECEYVFLGDLRKHAHEKLHLCMINITGHR